MAPPPADEPLPVFAGYETLEKLGEGGMCEVFRAVAVGGQERAIKVLMDRSDLAIRRFVDEAALLGRIDHPNVVKVHAIEADARPPWLVMDLLGGRDLEESMASEGPMGPERAARLFADVAGGLAAVHALGIRHRDIKPANLRLGTDGVLRLIDFGIAREAGSAHHTKQGFVVGTASYLPPETFESDDPGTQDTEMADVYALGQTMCEVVAGRPVHGRDTVAEGPSMLVRIMRDKLDKEYLDPQDLGGTGFAEGGPQPLGVPPELVDILRRATAREPGNRTQTARAFEEALRAFLEARASFEQAAPISRVDWSLAREPSPKPAVEAAGIPSPPLPPRTPPVRRGGRRWLAMGAVGAAGMMGSTALGIGAVVLVLSGAIALWVFRPVTSPAETQIRAAVAALDDGLMACRVGPGEIELSVTVSGGKVQSIDVVRTTLDRHTQKCITKVITKAKYPTTSPVTVRVPVVFQ